MNESTLGDWVHLGGYGFYVWSAYGFTLLALLIEAVGVVQRHRRASRSAKS